MTGQHRQQRVQVRFKWFDLWVGAFVDTDMIYVCPVPCVVICIRRGNTWRMPDGV